MPGAAQLGGEVRGTLRSGAAAMAAGIAAFGKNVRHAIDTAEKADDADAAGIFVEMSHALDKMLWFVESHQTPHPEGRQLKGDQATSAA